MAMEVLPTILMEAVATHTGVLRVFMVTMVGMDTMDMVRDLLRLNLDMDMAMDMVLLLSMSPRLIMDMDTTLPTTPTDTTLDTDMARGPLIQVERDVLISITRVSDIMARGPQRLAEREALISLDKVSGTTSPMAKAKGQLMLDEKTTYKGITMGQPYLHNTMVIL